MKAILFDPFSGASGDMIVAGLIDSGASVHRIKETMEQAASVEVEISKTNKKGISACQVNVSTKKEGSLKLSEILERISSLSLPDEVIRDSVSIFNILGKAEAKVH